MHSPTARVLTLLELLQARKMTGAELSGKLEVDGRTVRRYITTLQDMGIPVEGERGRYGAYALRPGYKMPPLMFTDEEAIGLSLGLLAARKLGLSGVIPSGRGCFGEGGAGDARGLTRASESIGADCRPVDGAARDPAR